MNAPTIELALREAPTGSSLVSPPFPLSVPLRAATARPTSHACLRYAQRVLGMTIEQEQLRANPALRGRCARGIGRLLERAALVRKDGGTEIWVTGTRAMIVQNANVITLLVASSSRGFGKRFRRGAR